MKMIEGDWHEFEVWLESLRAELGKTRASPLLFRGQGSSDWLLETTLERKGHENMSFSDFYRLVTARIGPAVSTFTGESVPEYDPNLWDFNDRELLFPGPGRFPSVPLYRYMVYLRHHAFHRRFLTGRTLRMSRPSSLSRRINVELRRYLSTPIAKLKTESREGSSANLQSAPLDHTFVAIADIFSSNPTTRSAGAWIPNMGGDFILTRRSSIRGARARIFYGSLIYRPRSG
jgi:hypothetical protein